VLLNKIEILLFWAKNIEQKSSGRSISAFSIPAGTIWVTKDLRARWMLVTRYRDVC